MMKYPFAMPTRSVLCAAAILTLAYMPISALISQRAPKVLNHQAYRSPDHRLVATVASLKQLYSYGKDPSRVEICTVGGRGLASKDHSLSGGRDQGFTVKKAAWTSDARFFVYQVYNSGGHSPWNRPIFFYSRKRNRFYSLDRALEMLEHGSGTITGGMTLRTPCTILTKGRYYSKSRKGLHSRIELGDRSGEQVLAIDLKWLEPRL